MDMVDSYKMAFEAYKQKVEAMKNPVEHITCEAELHEHEVHLQPKLYPLLEDLFNEIETNAKLIYRLQERLAPISNPIPVSEAQEKPFPQLPPALEELEKQNRALNFNNKLLDKILAALEV
jgi:hypothetical protein